jgi:histidine ammonia-lyase
VEIVKIGSRPILIEDVKDVANGKKVSLAPSAVKKIKRSHEFLKSKVQSKSIIYGVNTGFGMLSNVQIPTADIEALQVNYIRSHSSGVGDPISDEHVRAILFLRAVSLAHGNSGVSLQLVQMLISLLNKGVHPIIPDQGSVGASGDLAPLAHLSLVLIGEGSARYKGKLLSGKQALQKAGLKPIKLGAKEALALTNGTQFMAAFGCLSLLEAEYLADVADYAGAMSVEATRGAETAFEPEIHQVRPHPGQLQVARRMRELLLTNGKKSQIASSHENCGRVQDPYSLRCIPQVHGVSRDVFDFVRKILEREINSVTDNPLIFPEKKKILSGGNFHGQYLSVAMDFMSIASAELASISEQRVAKLMNPLFSDLPPFLARKSGLNSGLMIVRYTAASIVSENKTLCHPASVDSIPTSMDKEDHVSMGAWAARKASRVVNNTRKVLAIELLAAAQGLEFLRPMKSSRAIENIHKKIRSKVPRADQDRIFSDDIRQIEKMLVNHEIGM